MTQIDGQMFGAQGMDVLTRKPGATAPESKYEKVVILP